MKFYTLGEVPARSDDVVFRISPTRVFIPFVVFSVLTIALLLLGIGGGKFLGLKPPLNFFAFGFAAIFGFFDWFTFAQWRASLKPANWLLRCNGSGVIIKYRTFLNWRLPEKDIQAVGFDFSEIASVKVVTERRTVPSQGNARTETQRLTYLDFCLINPDTSALETHLRTEQNLSPVGLTIFRDYPVELRAGGILQVRWTRSGQSAIRPSASQAIQFLGHHVKILAAETTKMNLTHQPGLNPRDQDARILELARSGDKLGAVQLARETHGFSLTEAVAYVEKLQSGS